MKTEIKYEDLMAAVGDDAKLIRDGAAAFLQPTDPEDNQKAVDETPAE